MEIEIWKPIAGYEGYYEVSTLGRIKSLSRPIYCVAHAVRDYTKEQVIKECINTWGYPHVLLSKDGIRKTVPVHRLVAETFIDNPQNLEQVNHKNENKRDNRVANLEWCTPKYNMNYGDAKFIRASKHSKPVNQYDKNGKLLATYKSAREAGNILELSYKHISACCLGKRKTHGNFMWQFA